MMPSNEDSSTLSFVVAREKAKKVRQVLESKGLFDATYKLMSLEGGSVAIPVKSDSNSVKAIGDLWPNPLLKTLHLPVSKKTLARLNAPAAKLACEIEKLMQLHEITAGLKMEIPKKWERHQDLVIIPASSFISAEWERITNLWETVAKCLSCDRLARHASVASDNIRSSQVSMVLGHNGVVTHTDNGIRYSYDVTKCMFSAGNITEKLRIASLDCTGETVVDLFAGIGYFTLPYLVHAGAAHVHACEWNPHALAALRQNLQDNAVADRCTVHEGDCRQLDLPPVASRVNLGLIPSSEDAWPAAVRVLSWEGGVLHIHANVEESYCCDDPDSVGHGQSVGETLGSGIGHTCGSSGKDRMSRACKLWSSHTQAKILQLLHAVKGTRLWFVREIHLEVVKSYAPHIVHVVLDLDCRPTAL